MEKGGIMFSLNPVHARWALAGMALLMAVTRWHHADGLSLPDATLAVFFLTGLYVGKARVFALLMAEAFVIDYLAIAHFGVSDYCISPAYGFLIPTYGVMWLAGQRAARFRGLNPGSALGMGAMLVLAASLAFVISNGSFYLFSGRFAEVNAVQYGNGIAELYVPYLEAAVLYSALAIGLHAAFRSLSARRLRQAHYG
jgi:hypothetical protein